MTATIVNAAPMTQMLGTQDLSTRALVPEAEVLPQHLPKVYIYSKKGPTTPQLVAGGSRSQMYGEDSFDLRMPWTTHATVLSNLLNAQGNAQIIQRIKPTDSGPAASIRLYLDVLQTAIQTYERNFDGTLKLDIDGRAIAVGDPINGYKVKWVTKNVPAPARNVDNQGNVFYDQDNFGEEQVMPGDQVGGGGQSLRYPIMDIRVSDFGAYGNDIGLRIWAPTSSSTMPIDTRILDNEKVYPFRMACVSRTNSLSTARLTAAASGDQFVNVCFKPNVIDRNTDSEMYVGDIFLNAYQDILNPNQPPKFGPFGELHLYDVNVDELVRMFYVAEQPYFDSFSDFKSEPGEAHRFNFLTGTSSSGVAYQSYQIVTNTVDGFRFSDSSTIFAKGGDDGTMNEILFAESVTQEVLEYANPDSPLQDTARYPESIFYDSGFPLTTKYALCSFIAQRKDTSVVLSTHDVLGLPLTASQESSLAIALRTRLQMYPESEFYGTPTMRGMIVGRCGTLLNSQYRKKLPLTLEIATKAAIYMGAGNGKWRSGSNFDQAPANEVTMFTDVNVSFTPATVRNKDWDNGLVWVESYSRRSLYFPALKTVYDNDTSVLNSFFTMMACVELEKIGMRAHRRFSGVSSLSNGQLIQRVNDFVDENTIGRFDGRFVIVPDAYFTAADIARGYSFGLRIKIYAAGMKTVLSLTIQSYRIEDLATA